jgi:arylsulfatase A-like enzyme
MTATSRFAAAAVLVTAAAGWTLACRGGDSFDRRADQNVLLVTIDTLRADALSSYGGSARTPNLDGLASRGTRFDFAHAHAVLTRPSHASIFTGLYPFQHGVRDHSGYRIKPGTATLATLLKANGFATGAFVGGVPLAREFGLDAGFDVYDDHFTSNGQSSDFSLAERPAGEVVDAAVKWIAGRQGRWFAWVHVFDPHAPYAPPAPFDQEYAGRPYYGEVAYVDKALGPLFDAASRGPRLTTILVTGDHGEGLGDHGELTHGLRRCRRATLDLSSRTHRCGT